MITVGIDPSRITGTHQGIDHFAIVTSQHIEHQVNRFATVTFGIFYGSVVSNLSCLGNGLDGGLFFGQELQAGICTREVMTWAREDVEGNQTILGTPFDLDAGPWADTLAELLAFLVDSSIFATGPVANG